MNKISEVAYELYKQNWIDTHTTSEMRLDNIRNWGEMEVKKDSEDIAYGYEEYVEESGYFAEEGYACYDEFIDCEYQDEEYMKELLQSEILIKAYFDDEEKLLSGNEKENA